MGPGFLNQVPTLPDLADEAKGQKQLRGGETVRIIGTSLGKKDAQLNMSYN